MNAGGRPSHQRHRSEPFLSTAGSAGVYRSSDAGIDGLEMGDSPGHNRRSTMQSQRMTREAVRQWHMSRTQSVAQTLALMDRDGLFNTPQERSRSSTLGGNAAAPMSIRRNQDMLKLTRSRSMPQQGSGRHGTTQDMDRLDHDNDCTVDAPGVQPDPKTSQTTSIDVKPGGAASREVQQQNFNAHGKAADNLMENIQEVGRQPKTNGQLQTIADVTNGESMAENIENTAMVARRQGSLSRQVSDAASISGRAYARAPSSDIQRRSESGAVSGNGSVIINHFAASMGCSALSDSLMASDQPPKVMAALRDVPSRNVQNGTPCISQEHFPCSC